MKVLSLDISSTTIGAAIIESNNGLTLLHYEYYKPLKKVSMFESLYKTKLWADILLRQWTPDEVAIEDIAQHFSGSGLSTAKTMLKLAIYNRTVGLAVYERLNVDPYLLNVHTVRSIIKPKGYKGKLIKDDVPEVVAAILKTDFPYIYKKNGKVANESYDIADAIAVGLAFCALEISKNESK